MRSEFSEPKKGRCTETDRVRKEKRWKEDGRKKERREEKILEGERDVQRVKREKREQREIRRVVLLFGPRGWERVALSRSSPPAAVVMLPCAGPS